MNFTCFLFQKKRNFPYIPPGSIFGGSSDSWSVWRNYDVEFVESSKSLWQFFGANFEGIYENKTVGYQSDDGSQIFTPRTWNNHSVNGYLFDSKALHTYEMVGWKSPNIHSFEKLLSLQIHSGCPQDATGDSEPPQTSHRICFFVSHDGSPQETPPTTNLTMYKQPRMKMHLPWKMGIFQLAICLFSASNRS